MIVNKRAFCSNKADSKEHWPPAWTGGLIHFGGGSRHTVSLSTSNSPYDFHALETGLLHQKGAKFKTLRCVCVSCNNNWMSSLVDYSKDIIMKLQESLPDNISPAEQRILAEWAIMTTMVLEFADHNTITVQDKERELFRSNRNTQSFWRVSISRLHYFLGCTFNHIAWHSLSRPKLAVLGSLPRVPFDSQITTITLGNLVIFVSKYPTACLRDVGRNNTGDLRVQDIYQWHCAEPIKQELFSISELDDITRSYIPACHRNHVRGQVDLIDSHRSGRRRLFNQLDDYKPLF